MVLITEDKVLVWQVIQAGWRLIRFAAVPISWQLAHVVSARNCVCTVAAITGVKPWKGAPLVVPSWQVSQLTAVPALPLAMVFTTALFVDLWQVIQSGCRPIRFAAVLIS